MTKKIYFRSGRYKLAGNLVYPESLAKCPTILICHGAGAASKKRFLELQKLLFEKGHASFVFDFTGVGESEGKFEEGMLNRRLEDADAALGVLKNSYQVDKNNIYVIGTSMGGHIAARLTERNQDLKAVILLYPAAYAKEAENKPLNEQFTKVLRTPNSWKNSPAFSALEKYKGNVLVIYGTADTIIPQEIKDKYASVVKPKGSFYNLEGGGHLLLSAKTPQEEQVRSKVIVLLLEFLSNLK